MDGRKFKVQTSKDTKYKAGEKEKVKVKDLKRLEKKGERDRKGTAVKRLIGDLTRIGDGKTDGSSIQDESESEEIGGQNLNGLV